MSGTVAESLAAFAVSSPSEAIPGEVRDRADLHLLDAVGCGIAAIGSRAGEPASAVAAAQGGRQEASALGDDTPLPAAGAALANGTRCHALDFDDTHERGICHSSAVVGPAAMAVGEARGSTGAEVLDAFVLGTEVALRIAVRMADPLYERGFHPTPICGVFGAASAAGRLFGLDRDEAVNALGIAGSFAAGLFEYLSDGSSTKPLHAGWAAQAGIQAALLAQAGATGPATVIEGRFGLLASHSGDRGDADEIRDRLGERWETAELSIKPFPACHFAHSSTWAAAELAAETGLGPDDIGEIIVRVPAEGAALVLEPEADKAEPRTPYDAKFSLPFTVSHHIVHGELGLSAFSPASIGDRRVLELAARVRSEPLPDPPSRFAGGTRFVTTSGAELDRMIDHVPGSPANPLDEDWVLAKFRANAGLALDPDQADALAEALRSLTEASSLAEVTALMRAARPG